MQTTDTPRSTAALYARMSKDKTGEQAGVERQTAECRELAERRGVTIGHVLVDNDLSATTGKRRPAFDTLLELIRRGEVDTIVVWHTDRLYRLPRDLEPIIDLAESRKLRFLTVASSEIDLNTASGRMVARMLAAASAAEVEHKAERQRSANEQRARQGKRTVGRRPFGFDDDGVTVRDDEADAIRTGYADALSGIPLAAIARDWNARGLTTGQKRYRGARDEKGKPIEASSWRHDSVRAVLLNPRYAGKVSYRGEIVSESAEWPALVPESTWLAAQAALTNPARRTGPPGGRRLLSGLAYCGVCGEAQNTVHAGGGARRGIANYRCSASAGHVARMAEPVDEYVSAVVVARLSRPDAAALLTDHDHPDVEALQEEAIGLRERLESLAVEFADGELTPGQLRAATERLRSRLAAVETELASSVRVDVLGPLVGAQRAADAWEALDIPHRRLVVDALMRVTLFPPGRGVRTFRPETVGIEWRTDATDSRHDLVRGTRLHPSPVSPDRRRLTDMDNVMNNRVVEALGEKSVLGS